MLRSSVQLYRILAQRTLDVTLKDGASGATSQTIRLLTSSTGTSSTGKPDSKPASRLDAMNIGGAASTKASQLPHEQASQAAFVAARNAELTAIPIVPKMLGFAGAIPFVGLSPYVLEAAGASSSFIAQTSQAQLAYGGLIVSFLGAVHWGVALTSTLSGPKADSMQRERYMWSIFPSLTVWPAMVMQPAPGSLCVALLLGICYISDRSYHRLGSLPSWYMTLRGYLTMLAMTGMISTTAYYLRQASANAQAKMEEEDRAKQGGAAASS